MNLSPNLIEQIIEEYVDLYEKNNNENKEKENQKEDYKYERPLKCAEGLDLAHVTTKDIGDSDASGPIRDFLYKWGGMGRVLGGDEYENWGCRLAQQVQANHDKLTDFRAKHLENVDLSQLKSDIMECYESFKAKDVVGPVAAAKVLHLICPHFFPIWDNSIAKAFRAELSKPGKGEREVEDFSKEDYYRFMQATQDFTRKYDKTICKLACDYKRSKLKIVDEFLMEATQRPLKFLEFVKATESNRLSAS